MSASHDPEHGSNSVRLHPPIHATRRYRAMDRRCFLAVLLATVIRSTWAQSPEKRQAIAIVGLDLAKHVFQVHAVDEAGRAILRRQLRRAGWKHFQNAASLRRGHGSVRFRPLLGPTDFGAGP